LIVFFIPSSMQIMHALENHTHPVCISKIENHVHEKVLDCDFHYFKVKQGYLTNNTYKSILPFNKKAIIDVPYNFLLEYQPLSYQLRGPPAY
jgi:hypothetical protein